MSLWFWLWGTVAVFGGCASVVWWDYLHRHGIAYTEGWTSRPLLWGYGLILVSMVAFGAAVFLLLGSMLSWTVR